MFAAFSQAKVLVVATTAAAGLAMAAVPAQAARYHHRGGVDIVLGQPMYTAPVVAAAPVCAPVVETPAPVYVPAPTVVYTQPYYAPAPYVVVNRYPHYRFAPVFSFHGGWHR